MDRRSLIKGGGLATLMLAGAAAPAAAAPAPSTAPLLAAGLDPYRVYRQMFASADDGAETCWWYFGSLPIAVEGIGDICAFQEETVRAERTQDVGPDKVRIHWREAGVFREFTTGEVPKTWFDPVTGEESKHMSVLGGEPAEYVLSREGKGIAVALLLPNTDVHSITIDGAVNGDRVCLTQVESKTRQWGPGGPKTNLLSTLKIYASLAELKRGAPTVKAKGFYSVAVLDKGTLLVSGMMQSAATDEKLNPIAWERIKATRPDFFKDGRIAPNWS